MQPLLFFLLLLSWSPPSLFLFLLSFSFVTVILEPFSGLRNLPFDALSVKWLQISLGWFSKNRLDIIIIMMLGWTSADVKVAEHSFVSLWVQATRQIMARERFQLTSWNLASSKYTDKWFWLTGKISRFRSFHGNMNDWIQP